ncbi:hypothetical protein ACN08Y_10685 [Rothia sp. P5764]|uniref:hypothetical protein n=1 Tax=Rothia sp. P5764 TaxID=3402654 RepID=UPI003AC829B7
MKTLFSTSYFKVFRQSLAFITTLASMMIFTITNAFAAGYKPQVSPNFNNPIAQPMNDIAGIGLAIGLIVMVICLIGATILFVIGKIFHQGKAQEKGLSILLWGLFGAVILTSLSGLVFWITSAFFISYTPPGAPA